MQAAGPPARPTRRLHARVTAPTTSVSVSSDPLSASESEAPTHPRKPQPSHSSPPVECVVPTIESSDPVEDSFAAVPAVNAPAGPLRDVPPDRQGSIGVEPNPTANPGQSGPQVQSVVNGPQSVEHGGPRYPI